MVSGISTANNWHNVQFDNTTATAAETQVATTGTTAAGVVDGLDYAAHAVAPDAAQENGGITIPSGGNSGAAKATATGEDFEVVIATDEEASSAVPSKLADLKQWEAFKALSKSDQNKVLSAVTAGKGQAEVVTALANLITNQDFIDSDESTRATIFCQCKNYANGDSINNLAQMTGVAWFKEMEPEDKQRAAKSIAYISKHGHVASNEQQKTIIENTLGRLLSGEVKMDFHEFDDDPGYITYGHSHTWEKCISINNALVPAGDSKFPESTADARHAVLSTLPHEISHAVNDDKNTATYEYFQAEYRAWFVGFLAEYGKYPTRQEAYDRCIELFECYPNIDAARSDTWFGLVTDGDARKIIRFVEQFSEGVDLNVKDPDSADAILDLKVTDPKKPAPIPDETISYDFDN